MGRWVGALVAMQKVSGYFGGRAFVGKGVLGLPWLVCGCGERK